MRKLQKKIVANMSFFYKVGAMLATVIIILLMFPNANRSNHYNYSVGSFWSDDDLFAPFDFAVQKTDTEIEQEKSVAQQQSLLYFTVDPTAVTTALQRLNHLDLSWQDQRQARTVVEAIYHRGYLEVPPDFSNISTHTLIVLQGNVGSEHNADDYVVPEQVVEWVAEHGWYSPDDKVVVQRAELLCTKVLKPSVCFEPTRTQLELDSRLSQINYTSQMIQMGELIVAKGEYIDANKAQIISSLEAENSSRFEEHYSDINHYIGQFLLCIIAFTVLYMFLKITHHAILEDNRKVTFVLFTILLMSSLVALIERINPDWVLLAPVCMVPILMRVFFDMRVALYIDLTLVIILGNLVPNSFEFIFYQLITGMISIITVKNFERRSNFFAVAFSIFITYSIIYTAGILSQDTNLHGLSAQRYLMFFLNALLTLLSFPLVYLFEKLFGMTTALTLLEISSTNTPALRELSRKAPGTFQHSTQVANIAEDLINEIGGNALLVRVGALYHDIGKTMAPLYFTENQNTNFNPHDDLDYEESARIITQHVRDGVALAKKYHLPSDVTDFIRTHHGTTKTGYFYTMWMKNHPNEEPDMSVFQYAGPAPFSRETAVVMIVDSVEAATKSLKDHSRDNIERTVNSIIDGKIKDKQLDYSNITYGDINKIREFLTKKIISIYHVRVAYPVTTSTK